MNPTAAMDAKIAPQSPLRVTVVEALPGFRLRVAFADGLAPDAMYDAILKHREWTL
jgi:hypothetical protein